MIRKLKSLVFLCFAVMLAGAFPALAASAFDVSLGLTVETDTSKPVEPRADVPFKVSVENKMGESWIRINVKTSSAGIENRFTDANVRFTEGWVKRGDYYYLTEKAGKKSTLRAIENFRVPDVGKAAGGTLTISVYAEAIEARCVKPDFDLDDPWKGKSPQAAASYSSGGGGTGIGAYSFTSSAGLTRYTAPQATGTVSTGKWYLVDAENHLWKYGNADTKTYAEDGWYYLYNDYSRQADKKQWFYFDRNGIMAVGWLNPSGFDWYHLHDISDGDLGSMDKGFHVDSQDKRTYYLDESTGLMKTGWQKIGNDYYYFAKITEIPAANWVYKAIGSTSVGRWFYNTFGLRTYGSMYRNEKTPDGFFVDETGAWKK